MDSVFTFSASGIATARACLRKAAYRYVMKVEVEPHASAKLGTAIHKEMEEWFLRKEVPTLAPAKRLLPLAPNPTHPDLAVERPFRILLPVGAARGFKDLLVPRPVTRLMPEGDWSEDRPAVFDWKSTSNLVYAKTEEELLLDPQAILYGAAARLAVARKVADVAEVDLQWTYTSTCKKETLPVRIRQTLTVLEDGLAGVIATAEKMCSTFDAAEKVGDIEQVEYDLRECERYGGCPHRAYCTANQYYAVHGSGPALDLSENEITVVETVKQESVMVESALLAKLRAAATATGLNAHDFVEHAKSITLEPTPEPDLPKPDVGGLNTPIPPGASPINSPEAQTNVSIEDPPLPPTPPVPTKKSRNTKVKAPPTLEGALRSAAEDALSEGQYDLAAKLCAALAVLQ